MDESKVEIKLVIADRSELVKNTIESSMDRYHKIKMQFTAHDLKNIPEDLKADVQLINMNLVDLSFILNQKKKIATGEIPNILLYEIPVNFKINYIYNIIGITGFVPYNSTKKEIIEAVIKMHRDKYYLGHPFSEMIIKKKENNLFNELEWLTLYMICSRCTIKQMSDLLDRSESTVLGYIKSLHRITGIRKEADLIAYAIKEGYYFQVNY